MIKELFLAIALGALLGFGITGGFLALNKTKSSVPPSKSEVQDLKSDVSPSPSPIPSPAEKDISTSQILIETPENGTIVNNSKIKIKGSANPKDTIIIATPTKIYNVITDETGSFENTIDLESGANLIKITAIDKNDNQTDTQILVTYSTAKL